MDLFTQRSFAGRWGMAGALPRAVVTALLLLAVLNLLVGVFLRYVMVRISDWFDLPSISFFWVEETGEFALAWLTLLGAALGVPERTHFAIGLGVHRLPPLARAWLQRVLYGMIAAFGVIAAVTGWRLTRMNMELTSPGLGTHLGWLYLSAVVGGALIAVYALRVALGPAPAAPPGTEGH